MNAIEIRNLTKSFRGLKAVNGLNMTVPVGSIYGFIGENGSGKSTTEKMICGLVRPSGGSIKLFGKNFDDVETRMKIGVLIESPGCFPNLTVWNNMKIFAANVGVEDPEKEIARVLKIVRMEGAAGNKYKNCSLGMKQRVGIAIALLGNPELLVLDEPINGLDADGMRIVREVLTDLAKGGTTVLISSHVLGELEKIATRYGVIRGGKMIKEISDEELERTCRTYVSLKAKDGFAAKKALEKKYLLVEEDDKGFIRVYDDVDSRDVVAYLCENDVGIVEIFEAKISLEEYYVDLTKEREGE